MKQNLNVVSFTNATGTEEALDHATSSLSAGRRRKRDADHSDVALVHDAGREEDEDPQRTGPSASSGVAIPYPCCPKEKVVMFPGAHGCASIKCPNCGKYALFDYDNLTAKPGKVCRGASSRSRCS